MQNFCVKHRNMQYSTGNHCAFLPSSPPRLVGKVSVQGCPIVAAPFSALVCQSGFVTTFEEALLVDCSVIGIVLAKSVFQAHGSHRAGQKLFSKKYSGGKFLIWVTK